MEALKFIFATAAALFCWLIGSFVFGFFFLLFGLGHAMPLGFVAFTLLAFCLARNAHKQNRADQLARHATIQASVERQRMAELDAQIVNQPLIPKFSGGNLN